MDDKYSALETLKNRVKYYYNDVDQLLERLPYEDTLIERFDLSSAKFSPTIQKKVLPDRIRIGEHNGKHPTKSAVWGYLMDNDETNGTPGVMFCSHDRLGGKAMRWQASDIIMGTLRKEFSHCDMVWKLTATTKYYLYKRGVKTSYPVKVSNHLARELTITCSSVKTADFAEKARDATDGGDRDVEMRDPNDADSRPDSNGAGTLPPEGDEAPPNNTTSSV